MSGLGNSWSRSARAVIRTMALMLAIGALAVPVQAGILRTQLGLVPMSTRYDANTKALHQWHGLEQYLAQAYSLGSNKPGYNTDARKMFSSFLAKHEARLTLMKEHVAATDMEAPGVVKPRILGFSGAANTAEAVDLALAYEVELIEVLTEIREQVTDPALRQAMTAARRESAEMAVAACKWLLFEPPKIVTDVLAEKEETAEQAVVQTAAE